MSTSATAAMPVLDKRWDAVQRVAASASFQRSPRLRELLLHICERALNNHPEELREQTIGCAVFGRKPEYNPADDNIVRVEMRQLRKRLDEYFATEGANESSVILIPKGAYVPLFEPRAMEPEPPPAAPMPVPTVMPPPGAALDWRLVAQSVAIVILAAACFWLWRDARKADRRPTVPTTGVSQRSALWPLLFAANRQTLLVCADSSFVVAQALAHRAMSLEEYTAPEYGKGLPDALPRWLFTDVADARLVQRLSRLNSDSWDNVSIRTARSIHMPDFKSDNVVLLGSVRSNPWTHLFEPALNFVFDFDEKSRTPLIRNRAPRAGEDALYRGVKPGDSGDTYSLISLVPNLRNSGNVLIIAGTSAEGTETAGEFIMDRQASATLLQSLMKNDALPYFEVLLRSRTLGGVAKSAEVVAYRVLAGATPPR